MQDDQVFTHRVRITSGSPKDPEEFSTGRWYYAYPDPRYTPYLFRVRGDKDLRVIRPDGCPHLRHGDGDVKFSDDNRTFTWSGTWQVEKLVQPVDPCKPVLAVIYNHTGARK